MGRSQMWSGSDISTYFSLIFALREPDMSGGHYRAAHSRGRRAHAACLAAAAERPSPATYPAFNMTIN